MAETPRDVPPLETWTAPLMGSLRSTDARTLQHIFTSLKEYLKGLQTSVSANYYDLSIGSVSQGTAAASITGTFPSQILNLTLPQGATGPVGPAGPAGPAGTNGYSILNIDGGHPDTVYGGINPIDCGVV